jgi:hypothetical protein
MIDRIAAQNWRAIGDALDADGWVVLPRLLTDAECRATAEGYNDDTAFRSRVVMARHGFGQGEYRYFAYPLPGLVAALRPALYAQLVTIANGWQERMGSDVRFPTDHDAFLDRCRAAGQARPTPLLLRYRPGDYNCLHQDLYGEHVTEQRPRTQSRPMVVPLRRGDAVVFAVSSRPVQGARGSYRVNMRHGVSRVGAGLRHTLGLIFHDAA